MSSSTAFQTSESNPSLDKIVPVHELEGLAGCISSDRDSGNGYMLIARQYPSGDAECMAIKLLSGESLRTGGGGKRKNCETSAMDKTTLLASCRRAKTQCRMKSLTFLPDKMLTLNFRCDENNMTPAGLDASDLGECWKVFKYFSKMMRKFYKEKWVYLAVPEYTEAGNIHFHLAIKGFWSYHRMRHYWYRATKSVKKICPETGKTLRGYSADTNGQVNITESRACEYKIWNPRRIAQYLTKYITKGSAADFNKSRYSSGGNIPIPDPMRGWVSLGLPMFSVLDTVIRGLSSFQPSDRYEVEGFLNISYLST